MPLHHSSCSSMETAIASQRRLLETSPPLSDNNRSTNKAARVYRQVTLWSCSFCTSILCILALALNLLDLDHQLHLHISSVSSLPLTFMLLTSLSSTRASSQPFYSDFLFRPDRVGLERHATSIRFSFLFPFFFASSASLDVSNSRQMSTGDPWGTRGRCTNRRQDRFAEHAGKRTNETGAHCGRWNSA